MISATIGIANVNFRSDQSPVVVLKGEKFLMTNSKQGTPKIINCVGESFVLCQRAINLLYGKSYNQDPMFEVEEVKPFGNRILLNKFVEHVFSQNLQGIDRKAESKSADTVVINNSHLEDLL